MATTFKTFLNDDVVSTKSLLHEFIPVTGTIVTGTYAETGTSANIKNYGHGMFQSVYDYPYLSSSANHIFDITVGLSTAVSSAFNTQNAKKMQIYNQMAQVLAGNDVSGNILRFDVDGNIVAGGTKHDTVFFLNFSRLLSKDEIKKGTFTFLLGTGSGTTGAQNTASLLTISDYGAATEYRTNSPAGEYGILYTSSNPTEGTGVGLLYYQAGVAVITASVFDQAVLDSTKTGADSVTQAFTGSTIETLCNGVRKRWNNCEFNNTTELNSTIYFCRVNHNEFNYSSNPTYLSSSQIRVKNVESDQPAAYITTVGLYSSDNELLATAKLSEPLKKTPENEMILRVRLDY
jgi:hypothetical protein